MSTNFECFSWFSHKIYATGQIRKVIPLYGSKYSRMDQVKSFKRYLPQILFGPLLNTLTHTILTRRTIWSCFGAFSKYIFEWFQLNIELNCLSPGIILFLDGSWHRYNCRKSSKIWNVALRSAYVMKKTCYTKTCNSCSCFWIIFQSC